MLVKGLIEADPIEDLPAESALKARVPVASWFDDMTDSELLDLIPFFEKLSKPRPPARRARRKPCARAGPGEPRDPAGPSADLERAPAPAPSPAPATFLETLIKKGANFVLSANFAFWIRRPPPPPPTACAAASVCMWSCSSAPCSISKGTDSFTDHGFHDKHIKVEGFIWGVATKPTPFKNVKVFLPSLTALCPPREACRPGWELLI
ncbi:hypothetical protein MSG28_002043 [Choristoneura fumiferana]|uniref:Uncharacterized protein n=1 Tax=Choristoneura fumiferana TaxID=7141 RepID=A0ACC0JU33_CHOFU|nr:hypothetical protein MSG28_002043 [Choristoneura fumiferana]